MKQFLRGLGIFLGLVGVGVISAVAVVALLLRQEEVRVPDLTGQDIVTVVETLNQQGLQLKIEGRESNVAVPRDAVVSQTPGPGSGIKKGRQVHVVVSLGPSEAQTPTLIGEHFRKADILIRQAGFFPGTLSRVSSDTVERDMVIAQNPQPGSSLDKSGKISLLISSGKRLEPLVTPSLTGRKPQDAVTMVERLGLQYRLLYKPTADTQQAAERMVVQQRPAAGWPIQPDGTVDIIVNK